jgi:hypothetical protein
MPSPDAWSGRRHTGKHDAMRAEESCEQRKEVGRSWRWHRSGLSSPAHLAVFSEHMREAVRGRSGNERGAVAGSANA